MVTRQGSQCSRLMCFSAAGTSWVLMCLSLSPEQSMSTVLGCTNTRRAESQGTLSHTGWVSGRDADRKALLCCFNSPENFYLSSLQEPNITRWSYRHRCTYHILKCWAEGKKVMHFILVPQDAVGPNLYKNMWITFFTLYSLFFYKCREMMTINMTSIVLLIKNRTLLATINRNIHLLASYLAPKSCFNYFIK